MLNFEAMIKTWLDIPTFKSVKKSEKYDKKFCQH